MAKKYISELSEAEKQQLFDTLSQVRLFASLSNKQLQWLSKQGSEVWLNPGDFLFIEGDLVENFYVLLEGELQLTKRVNEQEIVLNHYQASAFTGEIPLLTSTPYIVSARALYESHILRFKADTFWMMLLKCFPIASAILRIIAIASKV